MEQASGGNVRRHLGLVARAGARGFGVWGVYVVSSALFNWLMFRGLPSRRLRGRWRAR